MGFCDEVLYTGAEHLPVDMAGFSFERKSAAACLMNRVIASMPKPMPVMQAEPEHPPDPEPNPEEPTVPEPVTPDNRVKAADLEKRLSLLVLFATFVLCFSPWVVVDMAKKASLLF